MRKFIYIFLSIYIFNIHNCSAQNQKIKLSEIINSIYFSKHGLDIKDEDEKIFFFISFKKKDSIPVLNDILELDYYNSRKFQILYSNEEKKILKKLKKVEYGNVVRIQKENDNTEQLKLIVDIGMTDYNFYKKNGFKFTFKGDTWEVYYKSVNNKWILDHIHRI